jgi:hypothetical protein
VVRRSYPKEERWLGYSYVWSGFSWAPLLALLKSIIYGSLARSWLCSAEIRRRRQTKPPLIEIVVHTARASPQFRLARSYPWKLCVFNAFALVQHKSAVPRLGVPRYQIINGSLLSAAPHIERLQKPALFFQILLKPAFGH